MAVPYRIGILRQQLQDIASGMELAVSPTTADVIAFQEVRARKVSPHKQNRFQVSSWLQIVRLGLVVVAAPSMTCTTCCDGGQARWLLEAPLPHHALQVEDLMSMLPGYQFVYEPAMGFNESPEGWEFGSPGTAGCGWQVNRIIWLACAGSLAGCRVRARRACHLQQVSHRRKRKTLAQVRFGSGTMLRAARAHAQLSSAQLNPARLRPRCVCSR